MNTVKTLSVLCASLFSCAYINAMTPVQESIQGNGVKNSAPSIINEGKNTQLNLSWMSPYDGRDILFHQASLVLYSDNGLMGTAKKTAQILAGKDNLYSITDLGILFLLQKKDVQELVYKLNFSKDYQDRQSAYYIGNQLNLWRGGEIVPLILELDGLIEVNRRVTLNLFSSELDKGTRTIFMRNLLPEVANEINYANMLNVLYDVVGKSEEGLETIKEPVLAMTDQNSTENTERFFSSELIAYVYKQLGVLPSNLNASNVTGDELSSGSGFKDILQHQAGEDFLFKRYQNYSDVAEYATCCGSFMSFLNVFLNRN